MSNLLNYSQVLTAETSKQTIISSRKVGKQETASPHGASEFAHLAWTEASVPGVSESRRATEVSSEMLSLTGAYWRAEGSPKQVEM